MKAQQYCVWLDCDPGLDDTMAIVLAGHYPQIKLLGVSTSAGNTTIQNTTKNALDILHNIQRSDVQVIRGSQAVIGGKPKTAENVHGKGGLGGVNIEPSTKKAIIQNNFETIRQIILLCSEKVIWANTGALTNLCLLLRKYPQVKQKIEKIVIMGGAIGKGNSTPAAQFNIFFDPIAFKEVLITKQQIPLVMIPLEVTHKVQAREKIFQFLQKRNKHPFAKAIVQMLKYYQKVLKQCQDFDFPPIHDPTVINYILSPEDFKLRKALIRVDICQESYGRTNCYFRDSKDSTKQVESSNLVALSMSNRSKFWAKFQTIFAKLFKQNDLY